MAHNIGEEIAGIYLKVCRNCDFVEYNLYTTEVQGEIDVVGVDTKNKKVFVCEVAIHLETGLQYVNPKDKRPDNYERFVKKFEKDIFYTNRSFDDTYTKTYMLWSPIVKNQSGKYNQLNDVTEVKKYLKEKHNVDLQLIINDTFLACLSELREFAVNQTEELKSPILRFMQIESKLDKHIIKELKKQEKNKRQLE